MQFFIVTFHYLDYSDHFICSFNTFKSDSLAFVIITVTFAQISIVYRISASTRITKASVCSKADRFKIVLSLSCPRFVGKGKLAVILTLAFFGFAGVVEGILS